MGEEILTLGNVETEKTNFTANYRPIFWEDVVVEELFLSSKISSSGKNCKYFIGYCFFMYKINEFIFFNEDDLLENYNTVRDKVNADIKKEFDSKAF